MRNNYILTTLSRFCCISALHGFGLAYATTENVHVMSSSPANGAEEVNVNTSVILVYSKPVQVATVNTDTFKIKKSADGQSVSGTIINVNNDQVTFKFQPAESLAINNKYQVTSNGVLAQDSLEGGGTASYSGSFTTTSYTYTLNTWVGGSNIRNKSGIYGTLGACSSCNMPGSRSSTASWSDKNQTLWFFGGYGYGENAEGYLNDLWRYDTQTNQWKWVSGSSATDQPGNYGVKGTSSSSNVPGARKLAASWIDNSNNLWLFGGTNAAEATTKYFNDLWRFDTHSNQWTWISGSSSSNQSGSYGSKGSASSKNIPGARDSAVTWTDKSGNLWLFGGSTIGSYGNEYFNDLWKYNIASNEWTWVSGSSKTNQKGIYGSLGLASTGNTPGARDNALGWSDSSGNMWLFGGDGYAATSAGFLNDLWKYEPGKNQWTWVSGSNEPGKSGNYGSKGIESNGNTPGARITPVGWIDSYNNLWLFGGYTSTSNVNNNNSYRNDLWRYNNATHQWTWVSGESTVAAYGMYGTKGEGSSNNMPGSRFFHSSVIGKNNELWTFGGSGYDGNNNLGLLNDLWKLQILH